jgi:Minichromosome loss protein, Mcl1, middle region
MNIRIVKISDPASNPYEISVNAPIKSLSFDPISSTFLACTTIRGTLTIFDLSASPAQKVYFNDEVKLKDDNGSEYSTIEFPVAWHPTGSVFAVGTNSGVTIRSKESFKTIYELSLKSKPSVKDKFSGIVCLCWSTNGRLLAGIDSRRILTVWDVTNAATDPVTQLYVSNSLVQGAGEPEEIWSGYVKPLLTDRNTPVQPPLSAGATSPRPCSIGWTSNGNFIGVSDVQGNISFVKSESIADSAIDEILEGFQWPLIVEKPSEVKDPSAYTEAEAAETHEDSEEIKREEKESAEFAAANGGLDGVPRSSKPPAAEVEVESSLANMKRSLGFVDDDEYGLRPAGDVELSSKGAGQIAGLAELIESGAMVTTSMLERHTYSTSRFIKEIYGLVAPQLPFVPGSTTWKGGDSRGRGARRYLQWNTVGSIVSRLDGEIRTISIEFINTQMHRPITFTDDYNFSIAALSESGAVFASPYFPPVTDPSRSNASSEGKKSMLVFKAFNASGSVKVSDWQLEMPVTKPHLAHHTFKSLEATVASKKKKQDAPKKAIEGGDEGGSDEDEADTNEHVVDDPAMDVALLDTSLAAESIIAVTVGEGWCAAASNRQTVRFFRSGAIQDLQVGVPGPIVTIVSSGALCAVIYHESMPSNFIQHLALDFYVYKCLVETAGSNNLQVVGAALPQLVKTVKIPLRRHVTLQWAGFGALGQLFIHDSEGMMYALQPALGWTWVPVCDTKLIALNGGVSPDLLHVANDKKAKTVKKDSSDCMWPLGIVLAPQVTTSDPSTNASVIGGSSSLVPTLMAVFCKGSNPQPRVHPKPTPVALPLSVPLIEVVGGMQKNDDAYLRAELTRLQRAWIVSNGLNTETASSRFLHAATVSASAQQRGESSDTPALLQKEEELEENLDKDECIAMDKVIIRMILQACKSKREIRAVQLASRLHLEDSFTVACDLIRKSGSQNPAIESYITEMQLSRSIEAGKQTNEMMKRNLLAQQLRQVHAAAESSSRNMENETAKAASSKPAPSKSLDEKGAARVVAKNSDRKAQKEESEEEEEDFEENIKPSNPFKRRGVTAASPNRKRSSYSAMATSPGKQSKQAKL